MSTTFPKTLEPGDYTVKCFFWECSASTKGDNAFDVKKSELFSKNITLDQVTNFGQVVRFYIEESSDQLPKFLRKQSLHRFFPFKRPSVEFDAKTVSIVFYHDAEMHGIVYEFMDRHIVCEPNELIQNQLEPLYNLYGLDYYDERVYAEEEEEGKE